MESRFVLQVGTGGFEAPGPEVGASLARLEELYRLLGPQDIIVGWSAGAAELYRRVLALAHGQGRQVWLWLPVFSELPTGSTPPPAIAYTGRPQRGVAVVPGEDFAFVCPLAPESQALPPALHRRWFAGLPFDGIFLDKVRHAAFSAAEDGAESGLGCFCPLCRAAYGRAGVDAGEVAALWRQRPAAFLPEAFEAGAYRFETPAIDAFFAAKAGIISEAVGNVAAAFAGLGLAVGFDVFAPVLAPLVGQDLPALARHATFLKPMFYRVTHAPAGLPFELDGLQATFGPLGLEMTGRLRDIWGVSGSAGLCGTGATARQLEALAGLPAEIRPGLEVNILPGLCDSTPGYVRESLDCFTAVGASKAVLSWNVLADTGDNLTALVS